MYTRYDWRDSNWNGRPNNLADIYHDERDTYYLYETIKILKERKCCRACLM